MNCLRRVNHPHLHHSIVTRTSPTPSSLPDARPTATATKFSSATQPYNLRPAPSSRAYVRYLSPLPNTTSIFAPSSSPLPPTRTAASKMSSSTSTPTSTQPAASSTPTRAPPPRSNHEAAADASPPHPRQGGGGGGGYDSNSHNNNDDDGKHPSKESTLLKDSQSQDSAAAAAAAAAAALPALPAPEDSNGATTTLEVDGKAVVLDHLGPMVVGRDGTVSRIANWQEMSEIERRNTLRVLGKRNQVRLAALRGDEGKAA